MLLLEIRNVDPCNFCFHWIQLLLKFDTVVKCQNSGSAFLPLHLSVPKSLVCILGVKYFGFSTKDEAIGFSASA